VKKKGIYVSASGFSRLSVLLIAAGCLWLAYSMLDDIRYMPSRLNAKTEEERLDQLHQLVILPELGYIPPEHITEFTAGALPGQAIEDIPTVIGQRHTERQGLFSFRRGGGAGRQAEEEEEILAPPEPPPAPIIAPPVLPTFIKTEEQRVATLGFPPVGELAGDFPAFIYYPLQKRFSSVSLTAVESEHGLVLYGATLCEKIIDDVVVLTPCIYRELFPVLPGNLDRSRLEFDLAETVRRGLELDFIPWARYAISYSGCGGGNFRTTFQFGEAGHEKFVSLRMPYSINEVDALSDLDRRSQTPCLGLDLFLAPETVVRLLTELQRVRLAANSVEEAPSDAPEAEWSLFGNNPQPLLRKQ
jgi:hypothetical protein